MNMPNSPPTLLSDVPIAELELPLAIGPVRDEAAFAGVLNQVYVAVLAYAVKLVGWDDADDVGSFVALRVLEKWIMGTLEVADGVPVLKVAMTAAKNFIRDLWTAEGRREVRNERYSADWSRRSSGQFNPAERIETEEMFNMLCRTIWMLPDRCRVAFLAVEWEGLSRAEVATAMKIKVSAVDKHIEKARYVLQEALKAFNEGRLLHELPGKKRLGRPRKGGGGDQ
jgi:RNA polymerase sigma factor (sigma-70 family)